MRVVYDENMPAVADCLGHCCELVAVDGRGLTAAQLQGADALLVRSVTRVDQALLADTQLRFVGTATSGVDHVDRQLLAQRGISFCHAPGANANAVVEYVLTAIAAVYGALERLLAGGRVGIVGYGHVGRLVAKRCSALGIDWCASDPWLAEDVIDHPASLEAVLRCDVICLHSELTRESPWPSYHLLGASQLRSLRPDQLLINASRGPVVDNAALQQRLVRDDAPMVVLDVWEHEPCVDPALLKRVYLGTAHIAGYSLDAKINATRMVAAALLDRLQLPLPSAAAGGLAAPPVTLAADSPAALLRELLGQRYRIKDDDQRLRDVVLRGSDAEAGFDHLRKHYPERREVAGSRVRLEGDAVPLTHWAEALDARVEVGS